MPRACQAQHLGRIVDGVDEGGGGPRARSVSRSTRGLHLREVGHDSGLASERPRFVEPPRAARCRAAGRAAGAAPPRRPRDRSRLERRQQGRRRSAGEEAGGPRATSRPVSRSSPGDALISTSSAMAVGEAPPRDRLEGRHRLAREGAAVPGAGVEPRKSAQRRRRGPWPVVVRSSVASWSRNGTPSADELDVALEGAVAVRAPTRKAASVFSGASRPAPGARSSAGRASRRDGRPRVLLSWNRPGYGRPAAAAAESTSGVPASG